MNKETRLDRIKRDIMVEDIKGYGIPTEDSQWLVEEVERQAAIINEAYMFLKQGYDTCAKGLLSPETKGGK